jgi:hypothetical protein
VIPIRAEIVIDFGNQKDAKQILEAVAPDNLELPQGLEIQSRRENSVLTFVIDCSRGIDSLRATVEDLMSAVDLSMRTLDSVSINPQ